MARIWRARVYRKPALGNFSYFTQPMRTNAACTPAPLISAREIHRPTLLLSVNRRQPPGTADSANKKRGSDDHRVQRVIDHIATHLGDELRLTDLAAVARLSPNYFGGVFRKATGVSLHRYVIVRRIERACELLSETEESVTAIAFEVGFSSHSHFATMFRRQVGMTPSAFREKPE